MDLLQKKLLIALAKKIKNKPRTREEVLDVFVGAGILTRKGKFTKNYPNLRKYMAAKSKHATTVK